MEPINEIQLEKQKRKLKKGRRAWIVIVLSALLIGLVLGSAASFHEGYHLALQEFGIIASCPGCF